MLPPERIATTVPGPSAGTRPARIAATPTAPAGSTTSLARSSSTRRARAMSSSVTVTTASTASRTISKLRMPGLLTAMPSAIVATTPISVGSPAAKRSGVRGGVGRLYADDPDAAPVAGRALLDGARDARDEAAAADRDDDRRDVRHLVEDLEPQRSLPGDHVGVIERRDEDGAGLCREVGRRAQRLVDDAAAEHDVGAVRPGGLELGDRDADRHEDRGVDAELARGEGDALRVIACRRRDDAALPLLGGQLREPVVRAADLVGAGALEVLALEHDR